MYEQGLHIPLLLPDRCQVVAFNDHSLFRVNMEPNISSETAARRFAANVFELTAVKPIRPLRHEQAIGYGIYPAHDQPLQLSRVDAYMVKAYDIDEYLAHPETNEVSAAMVQQAVSGLRRPR